MCDLLGLRGRNLDGCALQDDVAEGSLRLCGALGSKCKKSPLKEGALCPVLGEHAFGISA